MTDALSPEEMAEHGLPEIWEGQAVDWFSCTPFPGNEVAARLADGKIYSRKRTIESTHYATAKPDRMSHDDLRERTFVAAGYARLLAPEGGEKRDQLYARHLIENASTPIEQRRPDPVPEAVAKFVEIYGFEQGDLNRIHAFGQECALWGQANPGSST